MPSQPVERDHADPVIDRTERFAAAKPGPQPLDLRQSLGVEEDAQVRVQRIELLARARRRDLVQPCFNRGGAGRP